MPDGGNRYGVESHAHRLAKELLVSWLRERSAAAGYDHGAQFAGLTWRVNRPGPAWGVWSELPVLSDGTGINPVWDEVSDEWRHRVPTYEEVVERGFRPMAVVDVAVQHKGRTAFAIEIKHKHAVDALKLGFLRRFDVGVLEVPALWVLGQIDRPREIPEEFWLT